MAFFVVAGAGATKASVRRSFESAGVEITIASGSHLENCVMGHTPPRSTHCRDVHADMGRISLVGHLRLTDRQPRSGRFDGARIPTAHARSLAERWLVSPADTLRDIRGSFGFAVWEELNQILTLARDQFGQRPVYYQVTRRDGWLVASDRPDVVRAWPGTSRGVDVEALVAQCIGYAPLLKERTLFHGVRQLPAAHTLTWRDGRAEVRRYWRPEARPCRTPTTDLVAEMRERVISGVSSSVGVGENIGAHVSGGLDSSAVAVLANEKLSAEHGKIARAFSWSPPPTTSLETDDERVRTCELLDALDIPVSWTTLDASGLRDSMLRGLEPSAASGLVHEQWIAKSAVQAGVGVVLSGWGGDEFASFNGRGAIAGAVRQGRIAAAAAAAYSQAERGGRRGLLGAVSATRRLWGQGFAPLVPDLRRDHLPVGSPAAIYRDVLSKLHPSAAAMIRGETRWPQAGAAATQLALLENGHIEQRLASWSHLGDEHGIEYRYPLLDVELVEFCLTVPEDVHLRAPVDRWLFREAMSPWLPHEICWEQPKSEPAKFAAQLRVLADTPAVRPEGPAEAADIVERFFELRREFHTRLLAAS